MSYEVFVCLGEDQVLFCACRSMDESISCEFSLFASAVGLVKLSKMSTRSGVERITMVEQRVMSVVLDFFS